MSAARPRRALVLGLWASALLLALLQILRTEFTADLSAFLPRSPDPQQRVLIEQLASGAPSRTLLVGIAGGGEAERARASRALAAALRGGGLFEQVHNGEREAWAATGQWLFEHRYLLSPAVVPGRFESEGLHEALLDSLALLGTPAGAAVQPLFERDPSGETQRIAETLLPARAPRLAHGVWAARTTPRALLVVTTRAPGADLDAQEAAIAAVRAAFAALGASAQGLDLQLGGAPVFAVASRAQIEREVRWLAIAGTVLVSTLLLLAFASLRALAAALLPVATGVLTGIAAVGLAFGTVHGITLGFGATLIGESVDYAIYYLIQARGAAASADRGAAPARGEGWRAWLAGGWPTVRLGLWTSIAGFAALVFSGFPGLAQLGVFSIAGLAAAALTTRHLMPVLLPDGAPGLGVRRVLGRAAQAAARALPRLRWPLVGAGALAVVLLVQRGDLWQGDLVGLSPLPRELVALDAALRADLGTSDARALVVVQGADAEQALQRAEAATARLDELVERGVLAGYDSATRFLPSVATQRRRLASLPEPAALEAALVEATRGTPVTPARLTPFVAEVDRARALPPLTPATLAGSPAAPLVDALLLRRADGSHAALLPLQPQSDTVDAPALSAALAGLPGVQLLDIKHELDDLYARYLREALALALLGAAAVVVLVAAALRRPARVLAVCQPLALAVLLTLAALALAGVTMGILHLVGLLLVVAVGSNYALFFDSVQGGSAAGPGAHAHDTDTMASLLLANVTTVASFGLLALSAIPALSAIGRVVAPGALLALLLAAAFVPDARRGPAQGGRSL